MVKVIFNGRNGLYDKKALQSKVNRLPVDGYIVNKLQQIWRWGLGQWVPM